MKTLWQAFRILVWLTIVTGLAYPLAMTALSQWLFPKQANGSLLERDGRVVGSALLAQRFDDPRFFHPRPSACDYQTIPSGASNQGPTSLNLRDQITTRAAALLAEGAKAPIPPDLLTASGSGLDPHISPQAARFQMERVVKARKLSAAQKERLAELIARQTEPPQFGIFGEPRVNVLLLNLDLDRLSSLP